MIADAKPRAFYGWRVVGAAFVMAVFGWGMGFYGPPIFLSVIGETRGWPLAVVSAAGTVHFLIGALVGANLPACYRRFGAPLTTKAAALCLAAGAVGWATCAVPWQLFVASVLSGAGWGATILRAGAAIRDAGIGCDRRRHPRSIRRRSSPKASQCAHFY